MFRARIPIVAACAACVLLVLIDAHFTDPSDGIRCGAQYKNGDDRWPEYLYCVANGTHGNWTRLQTNGSQHLIAMFNRTNVDLRDPRYSVWVFVAPGNATGTFLRKNYGGEEDPFTEAGTYFCSIDNETCRIDVYLALRAYGYSGTSNLELQCKPPSQRDPTHADLLGNGTARKQLSYAYPLYNITWFVNSTMVGRSIDCNGTWCNVSYNYNSSFVQHHNVTIYGDKANTTYNGSLCLSCILGADGSTGINVVCSPGTKDLSLLNVSGVGKFGGNLPEAIRGEKIDGESPNDGPYLGPGLVFVGAVVLVSAFAGILVAVSQIRKKMYGSAVEPKRLIYRPVDTGLANRAGETDRGPGWVDAERSRDAFDDDVFTEIQ